MSTQFAQGDQFVGFNVNPSNGDLILRYVFVNANIPDANGRGVTRKVLEANRSIAKGRPLIFAPFESQGGTKGHTDFRTTDPYKYEVGRIVNIEPATTNLFERMKKNLIQTNSSYIRLIESEKDLWVADVVITNEEMKKILLNPATSHLIPRYVSPSFIHRRNPTGDYSRVDDAILDHIAIVNKPTFANNGLQIDGAAYGEVTRLRGSCFGDKVSCLNLLQTSSNKVVELEKCVSCPVQLLDRLTDLYKNLDILQIVQSSSQTMSSNNSNEQQSQEQQQQAPNTVTVRTQQPVGATMTTTTDTTPVNSATVQYQSPLGQFFKSDDTLQSNYANLKNLITQMVKEDPNTFRNAILVDAGNGTTTPNPPTNAGSNNTNSNIQNTNTDNVQSGETLQNISNEQVTQTLEKLKITEDELKGMKIEDIKKKFGDVENIVKQVLEEQLKVSKTLQQIKEKEAKTKIANILPKEAFTDERGFKSKEFDDMVNYLHKKGLDEQYIAILGVGLATLKNEQLKIKEQQLNLKKGNLPQGFGESIKQKIGSSQSQNQQQGEQQQSLPPSPLL